jgi:hypothetical protein
MQPHIKTMTVLLELENNYVVMLGISWVAVQMAASQEVLSSLSE